MVTTVRNIKNMKNFVRQRFSTLTPACAVFLLVAVFIFGGGCEAGDQEDPGSLANFRYICDVDDVSINDCGQISNTRTLKWVATGDDGDGGTAFQYDLRWSTTKMTAGNFDSQLNEYIDEPLPKPAGTTEILLNPRVDFDKEIWIGIKVLDEITRESPISIIGPLRTPFMEVPFVLDDVVTLPPAGSEFGAAITTGNWNNSGGKDIAIGAPGALNDDPASTNFGLATGAVYVYLDRGSSSFLDQNGLPGSNTPQALPFAAPDIVIYGAAAGDRFGDSVVSHDDLDGDGRDDLIIGAPAAGAGGEVSVFLGNSSSTDTNGSITFAEATVDGTPDVFDLFTSTANITFLGAGGGELGVGIADVRNLDTRNKSELAIGDPASDEVYIFYGGETATNALVVAGLLPNTPVTLIIDLAVALTADVTLLGPVGSRFGGEVVYSKDMNRDDTTDMAVGAPAGDVVYLFYGGVGNATNNQAIDFSQTGRVAFDVAGALPDATINSANASGTFGSSMVAMDEAFGLGVSLSIGDPGSDEVVAFLSGTLTNKPAIDFENNPASAAERIVFTISGVTPADITILGVGGEEFGFSLAGPVNVNGLGNEDLLIGAPGATDPNTTITGGAAIAFRGSDYVETLPKVFDRSVDTRFFIVLNHQAVGGRFGSAVKGYGNTMKDEEVIRAIYDDFIVGASAEAGAYMDF